MDIFFLFSNFPFLRKETAVDQPTEVKVKVTIDVSMFGEASGFDDITLVVEEVRISVINALLSLSSPIFREIFQKETKEKNKKEITLSDKTLDTFVLFLRCLSPDLKERVTGKRKHA
ncbi:hypothetical protein DPMN_093633 [Dreissena polymorpha]|uniref:BTB domain-containing protein n=1 Tax=Dreissena polymorpha TaxID=45954 RepID=A0A9D4L3B2_DREPO|nr:hypothetical protein DPMN_093633 [Dreissena polymorpha]